MARPQEAGVLRIITNKPDPRKVEGGIDVEGNVFTDGNAGGKVEGFYNQPLTNNLAVRAVGYYEKDGGYIDNPPATRVFPVSGIAQHTTGQNNFNPVEKYGGRVALRWDLAPNWTLTPTVFAQETIAHGVFGYEPQFGDLKVQQFSPDRSRDRFYQAAATLTGKVGNFDVTYAGAYMEREINSVTDYSDYSYFYDKLFGSGAFIADKNGNLINPAQQVIGHDRFSKLSHELRIASPASERLRGIAGLFYERQTHNISQLYNIQNFPADGTEVPGNYASVPGYPGDIWVTKQYRVDRDYAAFADGSFDLIRDRLILSGGIRGFLSRNTPRRLLRPRPRDVWRQPRLQRLPAKPRRQLRASHRRTGLALHQRLHHAPQRQAGGRQARARHRRDAPRQSPVENLSRKSGLRDILHRVPPGRHQPPRHPAALSGRLPRQL